MELVEIYKNAKYTFLFNDQINLFHSALYEIEEFCFQREQYAK